MTVHHYVDSDDFMEASRTGSLVSSLAKPHFPSIMFHTVLISGHSAPHFCFGIFTQIIFSMSVSLC